MNITHGTGGDASMKLMNQDTIGSSGNMNSINNADCFLYCIRLKDEMRMRSWHWEISGKWRKTKDSHHVGGPDQVSDQGRKRYGKKGWTEWGGENIGTYVTSKVAFDRCVMPNSGAHGFANIWKFKRQNWKRVYAGIDWMHSGIAWVHAYLWSIWKRQES